ncbi:urease accessory protein UreF [Novosphingobium sp. ST904]|uniref:urease accessory protein UreF n=1 Tax=Novosphingobium sp. ST904 TaxID=1684385 RepID=UPI001E32156C|nr:urease accessory protein UreF [Novosphingobium sp. ST904]
MTIRTGTTIRKAMGITTTATTMTMTTIMTAPAPMLTDGALHRLLAWTSPSYPVGSFTYSHGLETAVEDGRVRSAMDVVAYVEAVLARGGGWVDAVLFVHAWKAAGDDAAFDDISELAAAFRGSSETALEARQQGASFLAVTRKAWPHPALDAFSARNGDWPVAHCTVMALACAAHGVPLESALHALLHSTAANLVSAGVRLVPLGQTDGQHAIAALAPLIERIAARALVTPLEDLGTAAPDLELASIAHETLYTRLFRS